MTIHEQDCARRASNWLQNARMFAKSGNQELAEESMERAADWLSQIIPAEQVHAEYEQGVTR